MAQAATKVPLKAEQAAGLPATLRVWEPFEALRRQIDSLFAEFHQGMWRMPFSRATFDVEPFWRTETTWGNAPAVDVAEKADVYEITAELPGMDDKNVEVKLANEMLTIKGEKKRTRRRRRRTITCLNVATDRSSVRSEFRKASILTRSRQLSRRVS